MQLLSHQLLECYVTHLCSIKLVSPICYRFLVTNQFMALLPSPSYTVSGPQLCCLWVKSCFNPLEVNSLPSANELNFT